MLNDGSSAFPWPMVTGPESDYTQDTGNPGMSMLQWYAGQAIAGTVHLVAGGKEKEAALRAFAIARAMIEVEEELQRDARKGNTHDK